MAHAHSAAQGISRFTTCVLQNDIEVPYHAIKANIAQSLNIIVQIEYDQFDPRKLYRLPDSLTECPRQRCRK